MAINITGGFTLSANDTAPGLKSIWLADTVVTETTPTIATGGEITAFTGPAAADWFEFECANGEGDYTHVPTPGSGGNSWNTTVNYKIGGLSAAKLTSFSSIVESQRIPVIAEMTNGDRYFLSAIGVTPSGGAGVTSGVRGAEGAAVGMTVVLTGQDAHAMRSVAAAVTLGA